MPFDYSEYSAFVYFLDIPRQHFRSALIDFLKTEGDAFIDDVKNRTPVRSGDLRDGWKFLKIGFYGNELRYEYENNVEYASFVEYGHAPPYMSGIITEGMPGWIEGRFMMTKAMDDLEQKMPDKFDNWFKEFLDNYYSPRR